LNRYKVYYSKDRVAEAKDRINAAFEFRETDRVPFIYNIYHPEYGKVFYREGMAEDMEKTLQIRTDVLNYQFKAFPDCDRIPVFNQYEMGEGIIPTMFGAKQRVVKDSPPWTENRVIKDIEADLPKLKKIVDPYKDGWLPECLRRLKFFVEATEGEVYIQYLDHQSPFGLASKLMEGTELIYAMYDYPELVSELLSIITDAIIETVKAQQQTIREAGFNPQDILVGCPYHHDENPHFIIWDDFISVINPELYEKFCKGHNERLFEMFGAGHFHTCGPLLDRPVDAINNTKGSRSIDIRFMKGGGRTRQDLLDVKEKVINKQVMIGGLTEMQKNIPLAGSMADEYKKIDRGLIDRMNTCGGFIWIEEGSSVEEGKFLKKLSIKR